MGIPTPTPLPVPSRVISKLAKTKENVSISYNLSTYSIMNIVTCIRYASIALNNWS